MTIVRIIEKKRLPRLKSEGKKQLHGHFLSQKLVVNSLASNQQDLAVCKIRQNCALFKERKTKSNSLGRLFLFLCRVCHLVMGTEVEKRCSDDEKESKKRWSRQGRKA